MQIVTVGALSVTSSQHNNFNRAVVVEDDGEEKVYFVVETKGSIWWDDLRHLEGAKIKCGAKHFEEIAKEIENPAQYIKSTSVDGMMGHVD